MRKVRFETMKVSILIFTGVLIFLSSVASAKDIEEKCFCKALCMLNGDDNSDFYKVEDVNCEFSVEKQKELLKAKLLKHIKLEHGELTWEKVKSKVEIICYYSKKREK